MIRRRRFLLFAFTALALCGLFLRHASGGMPAPFPTPWTEGNPPAGYGHTAGEADALWQGISFFTACLLVTAAVVKALWNALRRDAENLPPLTYGRALCAVTLWGMVFVVVLTMISGARELMTPGAWRKQGWTYQLQASSVPPDSLADRRKAIENLRTAIWHFAATHEGTFPHSPEDLEDPDLWSVPGWAGFRIIYLVDRHPDATGSLLAFEPELDGDERLVLLTNGMIGSMRTAEIEQSLLESPNHD